MKCWRCLAPIKNFRTTITYTVTAMGFSYVSELCEKCTAGFLEWYASGNYIQKKINEEETE